MVRELQPEEIGISVSYPLPGTVFYERMKDRLVGDDWESSMENRLRFESDLPQGFYDAVREVLRAEHALIRVVPEVQRAGWSKAGARRLAGALWHGLGWPYWRGRAAVLGKAHFKSLSS
jgi:anaerobic magnesium-protoporphyrin IX monomethyl ester cyclase